MYNDYSKYTRASKEGDLVPMKCDCGGEISEHGRGTCIIKEITYMANFGHCVQCSKMHYWSMVKKSDSWGIVKKSD